MPILRESFAHTAINKCMRLRQVMQSVSRSCRFRDMALNLHSSGDSSVVDVYCQSSLRYGKGHRSVWKAVDLQLKGPRFESRVKPLQ